jgi:ketosteroid isomerase-like protein
MVVEVPMEPVDVALQFVRAVEGRAPLGVIADLLCDDVEAHELPNRLFPKGAARDKAQLLASSERGRQVTSSETYEVRSVVAQGDRVALEIAWSGTLAVAFGDLPVGHVLRASLAMFVDVRGGRIARIRNYDCYEP